MEERGGADEIAAGLQRDAALRLGVLQVVDAGKVAVGQHYIGEQPEMLCRL
jgi:hypothetical protein